MKTKFDRKLLIPATILALLVGLLAGSVMADPGVVAGPNFEIDGNTAQTEGADDWETVIYGTEWDDGPGYLILDGSSGPKAVVDEQNIFAKGGKFEDPTTWTIEPGNSPAQNDLTNIYIYPVIEGSDGHSWMVMGMERIKKQGTFDLDFEYNQVGWDGSSGTLVRTDGDVMVGFELSGNPEDPEADLQIVIAVYKPGADCSGLGWVEYGEGWCEAFRGSGEELLLSDFGVATMNGSPFDQAPWGHYQSSGALLPEGEQVAAFFFAEAAIDLTELGIEPSCPGFGSVHVKSRSSLEVTADLKDLAGPLALPVNCYIDGYKYLDKNGNGSLEVSESFLPGWQINLYKQVDGNFVYVDSQMTDGTGYFRWDNLSDGTYKVMEVCPTSGPLWVQTEPGVSAADSCGVEFYSFDINIDNRDETLYFGNGKPDIAITKTCDTAVFVGDDIQYGITVTNTGNVDLVDVTIGDTLLAGFPLNIGILIPGETYTISPTHTATTVGTLSNTASVTGDFGGTTVYASVSDSDDCTTQVYGLTVTKDANEFYSRYFEWDITKSVTPASWALFTGESGTSDYTVVLTQTGFYENDWQVTGSITISNPAPMAASLVSVVDNASGIPGVVNCGGATSVPAEGSLICSYATAVQDEEDANPFGETNTATATINNNNGGTTSFSGTAPIDFSGATVELVDEEATVSDNFDGSTVSGTYTDGETFTYSRTFTCDDDEATWGNTASFTTNDTPLTGSDDASVTVNCYDLSVTKTADEFYSRYFEWEITKSVTPASWALFDGESGTSDYTVVLDQTVFYENDWQVTGNITITNTHPSRVAELTQVLDDAGSIPGTVDCSGATSVPAGSSLDCTYATAVQDAVDANPLVTPIPPRPHSSYTTSRQTAPLRLMAQRTTAVQPRSTSARRPLSWSMRKPRSAIPTSVLR